MILLTGGRGAVATHLLALLQEAGLPVRVGSSTPAELTLPEGVPTVALDLTDPATFAPALTGVTSVFLYATPDHIGEFVDRAKRAGVTHVVLLSSSAVLSPDPEGNPLAKSHLDVEKALLAAPVTTTILRPGSFAANAAAWAWPIKAGRAISLPFPGAHSDPIHERDIAEAAFAALTEPRHRGGLFTLTGPESLTFAQQIDQLAAVTGEIVKAEHVTPAEWKQEMADYIPARYADALLDWWEAHDATPVPLTGTVEDLTGHPARPFTEWVCDHAADFRTS
ncbi:SDR family oxidoreductase [Streptomyces sp. NPDC059063]|uniref:SDR family oxidoreductase n=1 Tax=unclassified Streptomyces TaxID=2593676 RepID=UPI003692FBE4